MNLANPSALASAIAALIPVVLGAVTTYLSIFIESEREFRQRIGLRRSSLTEKLATLHAALLNHARKIDDNSLLRGDGRIEPDLVGDYVAEMFRLFTIFHRLEVLKLFVRLGYLTLFCTIAGGIGAAVLSALAEPTRVYVLWYGIAAVTVQVVVILAVYLASCKLGQYEDVT